MDFFRRAMNETNVEDTKLVGTVVPTNVFYYLNLFCVVDKRSKSSIIRHLVEEWVENAVKEFPEKKLIKLAAEMGFESWLHRKNRKRPFPVVLNQQEKELLKKGVSKEITAKIITKVQEHRNRELSQKKIKSIINKNKKIKEKYGKSNTNKE